MRGWRYIHDPTFNTRMLRDPQIGAAMTAEGERVAARAREIARSEAFDEGDYADSIDVRLGQGENGAIEIEVAATDYKAWWIEVGTGYPGPTRAIQPLRRALEALEGGG